MDKRRIILICLSIVFLGISVFCGVQIVKSQADYKKGEDAYNNLSQFVQIEAPKPTMPEKNEEDEEPQQSEVAEPEEFWPVVDFESLWEICPDVIGWIYLEDTTINYPMVQSKDNNFYLRKLIDGTPNKSGSIFMDYRCSAAFDDRHTVIYGHNMQNDSMFAHLPKYADQAFYDEHPYCLIVTPDTKYKINFFSGYVTDIKDSSWEFDFESDEAYAEWLNKTAEKSDFSSEVVPTAEDRVVTLSTCSYAFKNARYVLVGIIEEINE